MSQRAKLITLLILSILIFSTNSVVSCQGSNKIAHAISYADTEHYACNCESPTYIWRPSVHACVRDCSRVTFAKSNCHQNQLTPIQQCQCLLGFYWDEPNCVFNCAGVKNSFGTYNVTHIDECNCHIQKNYIWDPVKKQCIRNCTADPQKPNYLNGLDPNDNQYSQCLCNPTTRQYQSTSNTCEQQCKSDVNAHVADAQGNCQCNSGYKISSLYGGKCTRICPTTAQTGYLGGNTDINTCKCDTINGFTFQLSGTYQYQCAITCTAVANSPHTNFDFATCNCLDSTYKFNPNSNSLPGTCDRICTISHLDTTITLTDNTKCPCTAPWSFQYLLTELGKSVAYDKCVLDCTKVSNTDQTKGFSGNINVTACYCKDGYQFDDTTDPQKPVCKRKCNFDATHLTGSLKTGSIQQCQCKITNQIWVAATDTSVYKANCAIDCTDTDVKYVNNNRDTQDSCVCSDTTNFRFLNTNKGCVKNCGTYPNSPDRSTVYNSTNQGICDCISGYYYSQDNTDFPGQCVLNCTKAGYNLSTHSTPTSCTCTLPLLFQYNYTAATCTRYCVGLENSPGILNMQIKTLDQCVCNTYYIYDGPRGSNSNVCKKDCLSIIGQYLRDQFCAFNDDVINMQLYAYYLKNKDCIFTCPCSDGAYFDSKNGICACYNGATWNTGTQKCQCANGATWSSTNKKCSCADTATWDQITQKCICPATYIWNSASTLCVCAASTTDTNGDGVCDCAVGLNWNSDSTQCV